MKQHPSRILLSLLEDLVHILAQSSQRNLKLHHDISTSGSPLDFCPSLWACGFEGESVYIETESGNAGGSCGSTLRDDQETRYENDSKFQSVGHSEIKQ